MSRDFQKFAEALETAFESGRASDTKVEKVEAVPELPKLEVKEGEKECHLSQPTGLR